jgi:hypothetical protein
MGNELSDVIQKALETAKEAFIESRGDVATYLLDDEQIKCILDCSGSYPKDEDCIEKAAGIYVNFILGKTKEWHDAGMPDEVLTIDVLRDGVLHVLEGSNLPEAKPTLIHNVPVFLSKALSDYVAGYLSAKGYTPQQMKDTYGELLKTLRK